MGILQRLFGRRPDEPRPLDVQIVIGPPWGSPSQSRRARERIDTRGPLPEGHRILVQGSPVRVVGESFHRADIEAVVGRKAEGHRVVANASLVAEPDNPKDPNAIAVVVSGRTCGYLSRADAMRYQPVMAWAREQGFVLCVRADIYAGGRGDDGSWEDFGVTLYVATPEKILGIAAPPAPVPSTDHPWAGWMIAFTGDSRCIVGGMSLDRVACVALAEQAGMTVHERVTKKVQLLVDCDPHGVSGNQAKANTYGIPVIPEPEFWAELGLRVD